MNDRVTSFLKARGAENIAHVNTTLFQHMAGTAGLLTKWGDPPHLCDAGLCHAVYGTDGFASALLSLGERPRLAELIGGDAEALVYLYASCDRGRVYPQLIAGDTIEFRGRFTGAEFPLERAVLRDMMELTFANELELAASEPGTARDIVAAFKPLFDACHDLVTEPARAFWEQVQRDSAASA